MKQSCVYPLALFTVLTLTMPGTARAGLDNAITQWLYAAQQTGASVAAPNGLQNRVFATVAISQYHALRSIKRDKDYKRIEVATVAFAAHRVLSSWFPWRQSPVYDGIIALQVNPLGLKAHLLAKARHAGVAAADRVLKDRLNDGVSDWANFIPAPQNATQSIGKWQFTPGQTFALFPQLGHAKPFVISRQDVARVASQYKAPDYRSKAFQKEFEQVVELGKKGSTARSKYDTDTSYFWFQGPGTSAIGGLALNITYAVLPSHLSLWKSAKFYAAFTASLWDGIVVCFRIKYDTLYWRPVTAARQGFLQYTADPTWTEEIPTPPHPEYPSGHQCSIAVSYAVIKDFLGTDEIEFTLGSESAPQLTRTYKRVYDAVVESGYSRLYAGAHYNQSNFDGTEIGIRVSNLVLKKAFKCW